MNSSLHNPGHLPGCAANEFVGGNWGGLWPRNAAIGCTVVTQDEADRDIPRLLAAKAALKPAFAFVSMEPLMGPVDLRQWLGNYGCGCGWGGSDTLMYCNACGWRGHGDETDNCGGCGEPLSDYYACPECDAHDGDGGSFGPNSTWLDWVITGGETDQGAHKARPTPHDAETGIRDQCAKAGVPYHRKQAGEWIRVADLRRLPGGQGPGFGAFDHCPFDIETDTVRVGKKVAGRMLDGVIHDARPSVDPVQLMKEVS